MTSNVPWATQFENSGNLASSDGNWNRPTVVNTPQTNPASWPQLGAVPPEQEQMASGMTQPQGKPAQDDTGWGAPPPSEPDPSSTSGWGRLPDNPAKPAGGSGWGVPSGASWGQMPQSVDDGTAVWSKSTVTQQSGWGGGQVSQVPQVNDSGASGWGAPESTPTLPTTNMQSPDPVQSNPQTLASTTQAVSSSHPSSWAKAAAAGLSSSTGSSESPPAESEQDLAESSAGTTPLPTPNENDPVQQLVNSHEGWGKKPIQQGTSWNVVDNMAMTRQQSTVSNGTEAWGKPGGQMPTQGWGDNKPSNNWGVGGGGGAGGNFNQPKAPSQNWGVPTQQQQQPQQQQQQQQQQQPRPSYVSGNSGAASGWGDSQQNTQNITGRWNDMPGQAPVTPTGWGAPVPQQAPSNQGWGNMPPTDNSGGGAPGSGWGAAGNSRPMQSGSNWGANPMPQSPVADQSWGRPAEPPMAARRPSTVDNGTAAWGDPGGYNKVNLWDKKGKNGAGESLPGPPNPNVNTDAAAKGWGAPPQANPVQNRPPSPRREGWGEASPTRPTAIDNGTTGWGGKAAGGDKWDKGGPGANWNAGGSKPNMGWGQSNEQHWGQGDAPNGGWGQQMGKPDQMMKNNMDYAPRGMMPPQPNLNQQNMMLRNQLPPAAPLQLQQQFHQIQQAVAAGIIPAQVLNPQLMSPQHIQALLQLVNKASDYQQLQIQINRVQQNKNIPPIPKQQQLETLTRMLRQCHQYIENQRSVIMQNMLQKTQSNLAKSNGTLGGMDMPGIRNPGQSMMSPLNSMGAIGQALPSGMPMSSIPSPTTSSRLMNWQTNKSMPGFDNNMMQSNNLPNINLGPTGDSNINGLRYGSPLDEFRKMGGKSAFMPNDNGGKSALSQSEQSISLPNDIATATDQSTSLADIGPPEFTPGVPWKGFRHIDPELDPDITPGSVAVAKTMSINTVRDADQVLKRERSALSESSTGAQNNNVDDPSAAPSSSTNALEASSPAMWSTGANSATLTTTTSNQSRSSLSHDLWKTSSSGQSTLSTQAPPFTANKEPAPGWENNLGGWDQNQTARNTQGGTWGNQQQAQDTRGSWLVLTNLNSQVDVMAVRQLCIQQGAMIQFQAQCPMEGMALVKYASPDDAENAKKALNMHMAGSTMLVATVATDNDVNNFVSATASAPSWSAAGGSGGRYMGGVGSTGGFMSQAPQHVGPMPGHPPEPGNLTTSAGGQPLWSNATPNNVPVPGGWQQSVGGGAGPGHAAWSGGGADDMTRIMSPMHSLLPENLLGGENM